MAVATHEAHGATSHETETHSGSTLKYWLVALVLAVITILEVVVTLLWFSPGILLAILLVLSITKGVMIVAFFMHMMGDAGIFKFVLMAPLFFATSMILIFLLLFSGHVGIAG